MLSYRSQQKHQAIGTLPFFKSHMRVDPVRIGSKLDLNYLSKGADWLPMATRFVQCVVAIVPEQNWIPNTVPNIID